MKDVYYEEEGYLELNSDILKYGEKCRMRNGWGWKLIMRALSFDLSNGLFPLLTSKKMSLFQVLTELIWFIEGGKHTGGRLNTNRLKEIMGVDENAFTIWNANGEAFEGSESDGDLGYVYGSEWRKFNGGMIDQLQNLIDRIKVDPNCRRLVVSAFNPSRMDQVALPPCHIVFQIMYYGGKLNMVMMQRSADMFLGVPFNIASYAALLIVISKLTNHQPGILRINLSDAHIYGNHEDVAREQISRSTFTFPSYEISDINSIDDFKIGDLRLFDYEHHSALRAPMSV